MVFIHSLSRQLRRPAAQLLSSKAAFARPTASPFSAVRTLTATASQQAKILMVLYDVSHPSPPTTAIYLYGQPVIPNVDCEKNIESPCRMRLTINLLPKPNC